MGISQNRQQMQEIALSDNRLILEFLLARDGDGARHAMSIHMKHLIQILTA
jgi:DNA-binding GntR family transcriptional regulator